VGLMQQCLGDESGAYVAEFLFGCVSSFWYQRGYLAYAVHALLVCLGKEWPIGWWVQGQRGK